MSQDPDAAPPRWSRVLVRMPNWVGDVVMATTTLRAIRSALPEAHIAVALKRYVVPVVEGLDVIDEIIPIGDRGERLVRGAFSFAKDLRRRRFDAAILLTNSLTSAIPLALARIPVRIGYSGDWRAPLLTRAPDPQRVDGRRVPTPMPVYYQRLLDRVGIPAAEPDYLVPVTEADRAAGAQGMAAFSRDPARPLTAINPGARFGSSKLWMPERFGALARRLVEELGHQVLVLCGPGEEDIVGEIVRHAALGPNDLFDGSKEVIPLGGLRAVLEGIDLMVSTDTGPRHLATGLGKPAVVIMGSTHPDWSAFNLERSRVLRHDVPCGPCHLRTCPVDHLCMERVTVEEAFLAARELLEGEPVS